MKYLRLSTFLTYVMAAAGVASPQIVLDPVPARTLGRPAAEMTTVTTVNPNLDVAGGLDAPQGVAVDTSGSSPVLYVADTYNNRILAWKNATSSTLTNLQKPDLIIGQPNATTTLPGTNGTSGSSGLYFPTGLLVDPQGNLYVADCGNNRILRYPTPFGSNNNGGIPDIVLGQPDPFSSRQPNQSGPPSATTLNLAPLPTVYLATMAMDANGALYVTDPGNNRVLQYTASTLSGCKLPGCADAAATAVLGQSDFTTTATPTGGTDRNHFYSPAGLAIDSTGHLFVSDGAGRLLVFSPPFSNGEAAIRIAGIVSPPPTGATQTTLNGPGAIAMINNGPAVADSADNRILVFDAFSSPDWTVKTGDNTVSQPPPIAVAVVGQPDYVSSKSNQNNAQPSAGTLFNPVSLAVAGTDLFVADAGNNRVLVFPNYGLSNGQSSNATVVLGQSGFVYDGVNAVTGIGFWFNPGVGVSVGGDAGLAVDNSGSTPHLYVADPNNNRVLGYADARKVAPGATPDIVLGEPDQLTTVCNYGGVRPATPANGQLVQQPTQNSLCYPTGLAVDQSSGDLYVADSLNARVVRFPAPFQSGAGTLEQADLVLGQSGFTGLKNPTVNASFMGFPYGLVFDHTFGLLVSDILYNRVLLFDKNSFSNGVAAVKVIGQPDFNSSGNSVLNQPHDIGEDSNQRVYVADSNHGQVLIFNSLPFLATGTTLSINSITNLNYPQALWVNPTSVAGYPDDIWVGDYSNGALRFPRFALLGAVGSNQAGTATAQILPSTLKAGQSALCTGSNNCVLPVTAMTQDGLGNLYIADYSNRVGVHYPALATDNAASFLCAGGCNLGGLADPQYYLAPGAFGSLFAFVGGQLASTVADASTLPLPFTLGNVQVLVNGTAAPLFHVGPGQINFVVPKGAPQSGTAYLQVVEPPLNQVLASGTVNMNPVAPAMFTRPPSGVGQIAAINVKDGTINSATNPVARGDFIELYGTGQGLVPGMPADGALPPAGGLPTVNNPTVYLDGTPVPNSDVTYSGLAPCCVGLWQINIQIPTSTAPSNQTSLLVVFENYNSFNDPPHATWIAVK